MCCVVQVVPCVLLTVLSALLIVAMRRADQRRRLLKMNGDFCCCSYSIRVLAGPCKAQDEGSSTGVGEGRRVQPHNVDAGRRRTVLRRHRATAGRPCLGLEGWCPGLGLVLRASVLAFALVPRSHRAAAGRPCLGLSLEVWWPGLGLVLTAVVLALAFVPPSCRRASLPSSAASTPTSSTVCTRRWETSGTWSCWSTVW